jgi:hypothetical protein
MTYLDELRETVKKDLALSAYKELQSIKYLTQKTYYRGKHLMRYLKYMDSLDCDTNSTLKIKMKRFTKHK